jgi:predicted nucleic acid-binding protein
MTYLLDTNICIHFLRGMFNLGIKWLEWFTKYRFTVSF